MNFPFSSVARPNMDRFNFLSRNRAGEMSGGNGNGNASQPSAAAAAAAASHHHHIDQEYDDRSPLSPRTVVLDDDLEAQRRPATTRTAEMTERSTPSSRFMPRFRPNVPSFFSIASSPWSTNTRQNQQQPQSAAAAARPPSSYYSRNGGGAPGTTVADYDYDDDDDDNGIESPKSPRFRIGEQALPSTRLHLPNLTRTWTQGSNGPPSRPGTAAQRNGGGGGGVGIIAEPAPAVTASRRHFHHRHHDDDDNDVDLEAQDENAVRAASAAGVERDSSRREERRQQHRGHRRDGSGGSHRSNRSNLNRSRRAAAAAAAGDEAAPAPAVPDSRRRQRRREREREQQGQTSTSTTERRHRHHRKKGPPPKHFLFCFPWIKSRRVRNQILRCFVSGMLLALLLTVYLALSITKNINSSEFTVLIILIILFVAIFFCHGLIRLCMMIVRGKNGDSSSSRTQQLPQMYGPGGYAIPREPIRVVMARDEEAAGIESETTKISPPAYGLWRESVRVDPNRIYWQRNHQNPTAEDDAMDEDGLPSSASNTSRSDISSSGSGSGSSSSSSSNSSDPRRHHGEGARGTTAPRPPSYVSEDGVSYIVEAQGRSIAPTTDVPLGTAMNAHHPAEAGRAGPPPAW